MDSDKPPMQNDIDSQAFREFTLPKAKSVLQTKLTSLRGIRQTKDNSKLAPFVSGSSDELNRAFTGASETDDIAASPDTAIMHSFGMVFWRKPQEEKRLVSENLERLSSQLSQGQIDMTRYAKGTYFLEVLLHKYKNGNGRVARGMKMLFDKADTTADLTDDEVKQVLGIGREGVTKTGETSYRINFNPDFERLVLELISKPPQTN